jgi:hypothetical protein
MGNVYLNHTVLFGPFVRPPHPVSPEHVAGSPVSLVAVAVLSENVGAVPLRAWAAAQLSLAKFDGFGVLTDRSPFPPDRDPFGRRRGLRTCRDGPRVDAPAVTPEATSPARAARTIEQTNVNLKTRVRVKDMSEAFR